MALKDTWKDRVNGVDFNDAEDINQVANGVIEIEEKIISGYFVSNEEFEDFNKKYEEMLEPLTPTYIPSTGEEYNEIAKAVEVSTPEELIAATNTSILKGYSHNGFGSFEARGEKYNVIKICDLKTGDIIRSKLLPYAYPQNASVALMWLRAVYKDGVTAYRTVAWKGHADNNVEDIIDNGFLMAADGDVYVNIYYQYQYNNDTEVASNGLTAEVITVNGDFGLTSYNLASENALLDYEPVIQDGDYYELPENIRVPRYEDALGDIEAILDTIVEVE